MPVNKDKIGSKGWINSLLHHSKSVLIQLAEVDYDQGVKMSKKELIDLYKLRVIKMTK